MLGPDDINLQTKQIHYNYSVLIGSPELEESSLLCYPTNYNFLGELLGELNYIIVRFLEYDKHKLNYTKLIEGSK